MPIPTLQYTILSLLNGGAVICGPALYQLLQVYSPLDSLPQKWRRPLVALACILLGIALYVAAALLGYVATPQDAAAWAQEIWNVSWLFGGSLFMGSQITHALVGSNSTPVQVAAGPVTTLEVLHTTTPIATTPVPVTIVETKSDVIAK